MLPPAAQRLRLCCQFSQYLLDGMKPNLVQIHFPDNIPNVDDEMSTPDGLQCSHHCHVRALAAQ